MGLTLTQAFQIHAVVGILFCLPVFTSGISGFLETITNGQLTDPDMFTLHLAGVDFSKNMCSCGVLYYLRVVRVGIACHVHVASMAPRVTPSTRCPTQCYAFLRPLRHADRRADPAMRAQMRRVLIASTVAVFSTLVCYGGIGRFAHPCLLLAVDSIINDLCLAILVLTDEEGSAARDASGLRVGVAVSLDDSPGLELSDGAVLS